MFKIADLFAGIGGIRLGIEQGFDGKVECVFTSEIDSHCRETYKHNFDTRRKEINHNHRYNTDITTVNIDTIPSFDILLAGFPCQSFSTAGTKKGFDDARGTLFFNVVEIIKKRKPVAFLLENVTGLLHHNGGETFKVIKGLLTNYAGYCVYYKKINSLDFGLAQHRERVYIVGFREYRSFNFPTPLDKNANIKNILDKTPDDSLYLEQYTWDKLKESKRRNNSKSLYSYKLKSINTHSGTLTKSGDGYRNLIVDRRGNSSNKDYIRKLSVLECAKLQGFPTDYKFISTDNISKSQLGNSVSIPVVREIARKIKETLDDEMNILDIDESNLLIYKIVKSLWENDVFATGRKATKSIMGIFQFEQLAINHDTFPKIMSYLRSVDIITSLGNTYLQFNPRFTKASNRGVRHVFNLTTKLMNSKLDVEFPEKLITEVRVYMLYNEKYWCYGCRV